MPGFIGKKLCPELVIIPSNFDKYIAVSKQVKEIMADYDPNFCAMSLDEAYLDFTDHVVRRQSFTDAQRTFVKVDHNQMKEGDQLNGEKDDVDKKADDQQKNLTEENGTKINADGSRTDQHASDKMTSSTCSTHNEEQGQCERSSDVKGESVTFGLTVEDAVKEMRFRIQQKTQLTASAGEPFKKGLFFIIKIYPNEQTRSQGAGHVVPKI